MAEPEVNMLANIGYKYALETMTNEQLRATIATLTTRAEQAEAERDRLREFIQETIHQCDSTIQWRKGGMRPVTDISDFSQTALSSVIRIRRHFVAAMEGQRE